MRHSSCSRRRNQRRLSLCVFSLSCLVIYHQSAQSTSGEYIFPELNWSKESCKDRGLDQQFELCGELEFCEGAGSFGYRAEFGDAPDHHHDDRILLRKRKLPEDYYENANVLPTTYTIFPSEGHFGWRLPGTLSCVTPGPLIRLSPGTKYGLFVSNSSLETATNIHLHGLHIAGSGNGDDVTRHINPGDVLVYNVTIPNHHMGGTFLYHSHMHDHVREQVSGGAFGVIVVEEDESDIGTSNSNIIQFLQNEKVVLIDNLRDGTQYSVNGMTNTTYNLNEDEWYRFRLLHVNVDPVQGSIEIKFGDGCEVHPVAHDGIFRFKIPGPHQSKYFLLPASRLDLAVKCSEPTQIIANNQTILANLEINHIAMDPKLNVMPFEDEGSYWHSTRPEYLQDLTSVEVYQRWTVDVQESSLNDKTCDMQHPLCYDGQDDFLFGQIYEWTLKVSPTSKLDAHPFHVHVYPMQVVGDCGPEHIKGEFYDTVLVKKGYTDCRVRLNFVDVSGPVIMHCHILQHEELGAMGFIHVVGGPQQPTQPRVISCSNEDAPCDTPISLPTCQSAR